MGNPKVSVIMPVYNEVKNLKKSIESIQQQTFADWEFIIVNEFASDDGSDEIIKRYVQADKRIILIQKIYEKKGIAESLNMGIKIARGEYIARMDADDYSYPHRLEKQLEYMESHLAIGLCGTCCRVISPNKTWKMNFLTDPNEIKVSIIFGNQIAHPSVMFRRLLFITKSLFYDGNYLAEDYELWTRAIEYGVKCVNLKDVLLDYYWGFGQNISSDNRFDVNARSIMMKTLKNQLGVNGEKYNELLFFQGNTLSELRYYPKDFVLQGFRLLCEIEEKNKALKVFDERILGDFLCKRWNLLLDNAYCGTCFFGKKFFLPKLLVDGNKNFKNTLFLQMCKAGILKETEAVNSQLEHYVHIQLINTVNLLKNRKKIIIFGTGDICERCFNEDAIDKTLPTFEIIAFCDSDNRKHNTEKYGKLIISPDELNGKNFDLILIASTKFQKEIQKQLIDEYKVRMDKIIPVTMLYLINKC